MGTLRMGMRGVSSRTLYSRMTRKPLKKVQMPAQKARNKNPEGSERPLICPVSRDMLLEEIDFVQTKLAHLSVPASRRASFGNASLYWAFWGSDRKLVEPG